MSGALFRLCGVEYRYPGAAADALAGVDLELPDEACVALLGPNGAGKSTLLDLLLRWKRPTRGRIWLKGRPLEEWGNPGREMALVPQREPSEFQFTLLEYVLFGRTPHLAGLGMPRREDEAAAAAALEAVGLGAAAERTVGALSGGEHQLLLLARAMAQGTPLLLLDEPTSALDPANTARVEEIVRRLRREGKTLYFTTHDPALAASLATHAVLLQSGRVLAAGAAETVLTGANLSRLYGTPMDIERRGGRVAVWKGERRDA